MAKILVSLVSDQTIPNVELIKEFKADIKSYIFISTQQMKDQLNWILKATNLTENYIIKEVNAFEPKDIENKLNELELGDEEIILNITCGTKLMSLIVDDFFRSKGATIYYLTGKDKTYLKIFPIRGQRNFTLETKLTLKEYLTAYGFEYVETKPYKDSQTAKKLFDYFLNLSGNQLKNLTEPIRLRRGKNMDLTDHDNVINFLNQINYYHENKLDTKETKYFSGEWLEEYVYFKIKEELNLNDEEILTGCTLKKEQTNNEIDVVFIYNHKLYIIECKTSIIDNRKIQIVKEGKEEEIIKPIKLLPEIIYKSDALRKKFGLFANTAILTLEEIKNENGTPIDAYKDHFERAKLSQINIISKRDLSNNNNIKEVLKIY